MAESWKPADIEAFLDLVLPCKDLVEYQRALVEFGKTYRLESKNPELSIREGDQLLRRRSNRRTDYCPAFTKTHRTGLPWSWVESRMVAWALQKNNSESRAPVTVEYLAGLFRRSVADVASFIDKQQNEKNGIRGFDLGLTPE